MTWDGFGGFSTFPQARRKELARRLVRLVLGQEQDSLLSLDEVRGLLERGLDPDLPAMKAIGVRELAQVLAKRLPLAEAINLAKTRTRQYAKRQMTWMRNQMAGWPQMTR